MNGSIEGAGDIITGALIGRSVEPEAADSGAGDWGKAVHGACLNCGASLSGAFCSACGQNAHVHRTLTALGHDIGHGVFHFEGKVWRTLPLLVLHPGALTRRYILGERARFVSPMALFLFAVFLMFAVIHSLAGDVMVPANSVNANGDTIANLDATAKKIDERLTYARAQQAIHPDAALTRQIEALQKTSASVKATRAAFSDGNNDMSLKNLKTGWSPLDHGIAKAADNPGLMVYKLQTSAYKYSWALIPLSVPFLALLFFWKRQFKLYDHAIFVTFSLAFMMLLVVVLSVAGTIGIPDGFIVITALTVPVAHIFVKLREAYELSIPSAAWRTVALTAFSFLVLTAFTVMLLAVGLME